MRALILFLVAATASAQSHLQLQNSHTTESLRGVSAVSAKIAWASGTHGTYLRTVDGGTTWIAKQVPDADKLDFRGVVAFSADEAFLMSSGPGDQSRIYHTSDGGQHWQLEFTNTNPKGFFDSIAFWDPKHGIVLGDPIPDGAGKLHFELLETDDGQTWHAMPSAGLPEATEGEGAFAASNTCIAILRGSRKISSGNKESSKMESSRAEALKGEPSKADSWKGEPWKSGPSGARKAPDSRGALAPASPEGHIWFATGGKVARVFHSSDGGTHWEVVDTPIVHGPESAGIFSIAFRNERDGVIAGGDYKQPNADGPNLAFTHDGGKSWQLAEIHPQVFFSAAEYGKEAVRVVAQDFVLDAQSQSSGRNLSVAKKEGAFNAISPLPKGKAWIVGSIGLIAAIP